MNLYATTLNANAYHIPLTDESVQVRLGLE